MATRYKRITIIEHYTEVTTIKISKLKTNIMLDRIIYFFDNVTAMYILMLIQITLAGSMLYIAYLGIIAMLS